MFGMWTPASVLSGWAAASASGTEAGLDEDAVVRRFLLRAPDSRAWVTREVLSRELRNAVALLADAAEDQLPVLIESLERGDASAAKTFFSDAEQASALSPFDAARGRGALALSSDVSEALSDYGHAFGNGDGVTADMLAPVREVATGLALYLGREHLASGALAAAEEVLIHAEAVCPQEGSMLGEVLAGLGLTAHQKGDLEAAEARYGRALDLLDDGASRVAVQVNLALILRRTGRGRAAVGLLESAYSNVDDDLSRAALIAGNLGELALEVSDYQRARDCFAAAVTAEHRLGNEVEEAACQEHLGLAERQLYHYRAAETALRRAARMFAAQSRPEAEERAHAALAAVALAQDDFRGADLWFGRAYAQASERGDWERALVMLEELVLIAERRGLPSQSDAYLDRARKGAEAHGRADVVMRVIKLAVDMTERRGDDDRTELRLKDGLSAAQAMEQAAEAALFADRLGHLSRDYGANEAAEGYFRQALEIDRARNDRISAAAAMVNLGALAAESGNRGAAEAHWRQAADMYDSAGAPDEADRIRDLLEELTKAQS